MAKDERTLVKRSDKVSFFGNMSTGTEVFNRMRGFTTLNGSKNPKEYSRQYVDEDFETSDVTGYSPSIDFGFDQYMNDPVHDEMVEILDGEKTGTEARRNIVTVDFSRPLDNGGYKATKRTYAIIGDNEGDSMDAYTYSGTFRSAGSRIEGKATLNEDSSVVTFTETSNVNLMSSPEKTNIKATSNATTEKEF